MLEQPTSSVSQEEAPERALLRSFFEKQEVTPKSERPNLNDLIDMFQSGTHDAKELESYIRDNFENAAAIIPKDFDPPIHIGRKGARDYNEIVNNQLGVEKGIRYLSAEHNIERFTRMMLDAVAAAKKKPHTEPLQIHLHVMSVLNENDKKDKEKIQNAKAIQAFFLATYSKDPRFKGVKIQITHTIAPMRDHQMRNEDGKLLSFGEMDKWLAAHRGHPEEEPGVVQVSNYHCKAGQGRSATAMACEGIRYNGQLPSEASREITDPRSRPSAHGIDYKDTRPDQKCFMYAYFFHAAAEALTSGGISNKLLERFDGVNGVGGSMRAYAGSSPEFEARAKDDPTAEKEIDKLVAEARGMLSIDYEHKLDDNGAADADQWANTVTDEFIEFRGRFQEKYHVDLLDRLIIDYAKDLNSHSEAQHNNLVRVLKNAKYPSTPEDLISYSQSSPNTPPKEVQQAIARAMIKDAYRPLSGWEKFWAPVKHFFGFATRDEMSISRPNLQKLCELGGVYNTPSLLPHDIEQHMPEREPRLSDEDRSVRLQTLSTSLSSAGSSDLGVSRAISLRQHEEPPVPPPSRRDGLTL